MTTPNFRALCAELANHLQARVRKEDQEIRSKGYYSESQQLIDRARAALAEPELPADGEVGETVTWLREEADTAWADSCPIAAGRLNRAADLLEQFSKSTSI